MDAFTTAASNASLRERILQDMTMRGFGAHTQKYYIRHVRSFAAFLGRPPDTATIEDLRRFQVDQHERAVGPATINGAVSAWGIVTVQLGVQLTITYEGKNVVGVGTINVTVKISRFFKKSLHRGIRHKL